RERADREARLEGGRAGAARAAGHVLLHARRLIRARLHRLDRRQGLFVRRKDRQTAPVAQHGPPRLRGARRLAGAPAPRGAPATRSGVSTRARRSPARRPSWTASSTSRRSGSGPSPWTRRPAASSGRTTTASTPA